MATAVVSAPGKINLTLDILGRREDGYHEMEMLMHAVSLENTVRLTTLDRPGIRLNCSNPAVPTGEKNLAYRAAQAFSPPGARGRAGNSGGKACFPWRRAWPVASCRCRRQYW